MYQVQWGRKGRWKRQEFTDRGIATEFCKKTASECNGMERVLLIEQGSDNEPRTIMSMEGLR